MSRPAIKVGVDIGGTFTDVVMEVGDRMISTKVLTTYSAPEDAILAGLQDICSRSGTALSDIDLIIHGTTLATNALIERRGAHAALVTTKGFRDVIEMRTEGRFEQYDLNLKLPDPLISRQHRHVVNERIASDGRVLIGLEDAEIEALVEVLRNGAYQSVAVGFLHAYQNPVHEQKVGEAIRKSLPNVMVSLSSEVSPQMREYERFNTTCANAYVKPVMQAYLGRLVERLANIGVGAPVYLMHSGGGIISLETASDFPVRLVESGPAGGAIYAADIARRHGFDRVLSFDMGGTTAKICLIKDHAPNTARVFEVARSYRFKKGSGMPISIPVIDMVEIGAGGGSIAHVDTMRQIRVGPESAGSEPGPACYGQGGDRPAVTDADLVLGRLDPDNFAGGMIKLSTDASRTALEQEIGRPLGHDAITAAYGVSEVVDENMANAARVHAVENGEDLADYTMIAFGGAAPVHAARLCQKLGIKRLVIPEGAGVGSAIGFLRAPFSYEASRSAYTRLSEYSDADATGIVSALKDETMRFVRNCEPSAPIEYDVRAFMRYVGQGWEIPVDVDPHRLEEAVVRAGFERTYSDLFGRIVDGLDIEIATWSVKASTPLEDTAAARSVSLSETTQSAETERTLFDPVAGTFVTATSLERSGVSRQTRVAGPAVIVETETATVVPEKFFARSLADGTLILERETDDVD